MNRLKEIIEGKDCFVLLGGASLELLRQNAQEFKELDVCWCGMNLFVPAKAHILDSIGKKFSLIFDISGIKNIIPYEKRCRIPRVARYLKEGEGLFITSNEVKRNFSLAKHSEIFDKYKDKIVFIEEIIDLDLIHNSLMAYLYLLTYYKVRRVFLFGCDGYQGEYIEKNCLLSYFCSINVKEDLEIAYDGSIYSGLPSDTNALNSGFKQIYLDYCTKKELVPRNIYNVNPSSFITIFPRINFEKVKEILKGE